MSHCISDEDKRAGRELMSTSQNGLLNPPTDGIPRLSKAGESIDDNVAPNSFQEQGIFFVLTVNCKM